MTKHTFYLSALLLLLSCSKKASELPLAASSSAVPAELKSCKVDSGSVCGADGKTYENECRASVAGNLSYESGTCEELH